MERQWNDLSYIPSADDSWIVTDPDSLQLQRAIEEDGRTTYEMVQANLALDNRTGDVVYVVSYGHVDLADYESEEILEYLAMYGYEGPNSLVDSCGGDEKEAERLIAEMVFEVETMSFDLERCDTWNEAVLKIQNITGVNLQGYFKPEKSSLEEKIQNAGKRTEPARHQEDESYIR